MTVCVDTKCKKQSKYLENDMTKIISLPPSGSVIDKTHHRDDVGDAVAAVDDSARQRPLAHLSGCPGGC